MAERSSREERKKRLDTWLAMSEEEKKKNFDLIWGGDEEFKKERQRKMDSMFGGDEIRKETQGKILALYGFFGKEFSNPSGPAEGMTMSQTRDMLDKISKRFGVDQFTDEEKSMYVEMVSKPTVKRDDKSKDDKYFMLGEIFYKDASFAKIGEIYTEEQVRTIYRYITGEDDTFILDVDLVIMKLILAEEKWEESLQRRAVNNPELSEKMAKMYSNRK